jgi:hypothetical protein
LPTPTPYLLRRITPLLLAAASVAPIPARAAQVWTALASEKIRPATTARSGASAHIAAARNEFEAFQIVVTGAAGNVRATASELSGPSTLGGIRLYRAALIQVQTASALDGATGPWPDALVPDVDELANERRSAFPFAVPSGESRAIWVEVFVPPEAPAGEYTGSIDVSWDGGAATVPVTLTVWPFTLPSSASLKTAFGFTYGAIPSGHGVSAAGAFAELRERYGRLALDHRVTLSHVDDGSAALDHAASYYGPSLEGAAPTTLRGARMTTYELLYDARSWSSFFDGKGWLDRLFQYTCDEPPLTCAWSDIPSRAATARAANVRTLVTTAIQDADAHGVTSSIDIIVPVINYLDDKSGTYGGNQRAKYDAFLAASPRREIWSYQSCMSHGCGGTVNFGSPSWSDNYFTGWPSYMIDASAVRNRAMEWLSFRYRLAGELYYETAMAFSHDAWTSQWDFNGNGDGTLFYPGTPGKIGGATHVPVASIRLKMIREGMEDYEYLKLLADAGDEAFAQRVAGALFPNAYATEVAPAALMAAREELARRIVELGASAPTPDGAPSPLPGAPIEAGVALPVVRGGCAAGGSSGLAAIAGLLGALGIRRRRER